MSFEGDGVGIGISSDSNSYEVSIAAGFYLTNGIRATIGITYDEKTDEVYASAGLGVSF
jgi:hypothetical protein